MNDWNSNNNNNNKKNRNIICKIFFNFMSLYFERPNYNAPKIDITPSIVTWKRPCRKILLLTQKFSLFNGYIKYLTMAILNSYVKIVRITRGYLLLIPFFIGFQPSKLGGAGFCWPIHSSRRGGTTKFLSIFIFHYEASIWGGTPMTLESPRWWMSKKQLPTINGNVNRGIEEIKAIPRYSHFMTD